MSKPFKMRGFPMVQGTTSHASALKREVVVEKTKEDVKAIEHADKKKYGTTLSAYYADKGGLPSVKARAKTYAGAGLGKEAEYKGTSEQNKRLQKHLVSGTKKSVYGGKDDQNLKKTVETKPDPTTGKQEAKVTKYEKGAVKKGETPKAADVKKKKTKKAFAGIRAKRQAKKAEKQA